MTAGRGNPKTTQGSIYGMSKESGWVQCQGGAEASENNRLSSYGNGDAVLINVKKRSRELMPQGVVKVGTNSDCCMCRRGLGTSLLVLLVRHQGSFVNHDDRNGSRRQQGCG